LLKISGQAGIDNFYDITHALPLTSIFRRRRLGLISHVARLNPVNDTRRALAVNTPSQWKKTSREATELLAICSLEGHEGCRHPRRYGYGGRSDAVEESCCWTCNDPGAHASWVRYTLFWEELWPIERVPIEGLVDYTLKDYIILRILITGKFVLPDWITWYSISCHLTKGAINWRFRQEKIFRNTAMLTD